MHPVRAAARVIAMTATVFVLLGLFLCFLGARSVRFAVLVAAFCAAWLIADAAGSDVATTLLVAVGGAVGALLFTILLARFVFFAAGLVLGGAIGTTLFEVLDQGETSWLLAIVFIPTMAVVGGFLASRFRRPFLIWATAFAGSAMVVDGIGRIDTGLTSPLRHPDDTLSGLVVAVLWVGLALVGRSYQASRAEDR